VIDGNELTTQQQRTTPTININHVNGHQTHMTNR